MTAEAQLAAEGIAVGLAAAIALSFLLTSQLGTEAWESRQALEFSVTRKFLPRIIDHFFMLFVTAVVVKDEIDIKYLLDPSFTTLDSILQVTLLCFSWHFVFRDLLGFPGPRAIEYLKENFVHSRISSLHSAVSLVACIICMGTMAVVSSLT